MPEPNPSPELRWCFSSMGCPELSLRETAALATRFDVPLVELRSLNGEIDLPKLAAAEGWLKQAPEELLDRQPVEVVAFNGSARLDMPFEEAAREFEAFAPLLAHFGSKYLRIFDGNIDTTGDFDTVWRWLDAWEKLRAERGWNFSLSIETHDSLLAPGPVERLFAKGHEHVVLLWDSHHTWKKGGVDPVVCWEAFRPHTRHIHVKDSVTRGDDYQYTLPGEGEFPLRELLTRLKADAFAGPVSLEWEKLWRKELADLDVALAALAKVRAGL